jgi:hypothetical protein
VIADMRGWIGDCQWADVDQVEDLTDAEVIAGVEAHYEGGVHQFVTDGF